VTVVEKLQQDILHSMKAKDDARTGALRLLLSNVKNKQIELGRELSADDLLSVVQKEVKQRKDSITQYAAANRLDLVAEEQAELDVLQEYLPAQLSEAEIDQHVESALAQMQPAGPADMGKVMAALSGLKGQADMGMVSQLVREKMGK
jgi:uncharacterized protein YqeY